MKGLIEIFYAPGKVFDYVRERRAWAAPFFAGLILFGVMYAYIVGQIGMTNIVRHSIEQSKRGATLTDEQKEQQIAAANTTTVKAISACAALIASSGALLIFALLFMAIAGVSGHSIQFSQALGTVSYVSWPFGVVRSLLSILVIALAADKAELDPQHLLAFNAGAFLDKATTAKPLFSLASSFDLFTFATMLFGAYGLSRVAQIKFSKALTGIILIWVVFTIIGMGWAAIF